MLVRLLDRDRGNPRADEPLVVDPLQSLCRNIGSAAALWTDEEYYRTDQLKPGQELEVYVETEDGWLGVRPPDTSFSWIPGQPSSLKQ